MAVDVKAERHRTGAACIYCTTWLLIKSKQKVGTKQNTGLLNVTSHTATKSDQMLDEVVGSM